MSNIKSFPATRLIIALMAYSTFSCTLASAAIISSPQVVAYTGMPAPEGGFYSDQFLNPVISQSGQVAFFSRLTGSSSLRGIFAGQPHSLQAVALDGKPAPDGGIYQGLSVPVINAAGQVAFTSRATSVFLGKPGELQLVASPNTIIPEGGSISTVEAPILNEAGQVVFKAILTNGNQGIFAGSANTFQIVAIQGQSAPRGGNYVSFGNPVLNGNGEVAFRGTLVEAPVLQGIYFGKPGSLQTVALTTDNDPLGEAYSAFQSEVRINNAGQIAFGNQSTSKMYAGTLGAIQIFATWSDYDPENRPYSFISNANLALNSSGQIAYGAGVFVTGTTSALGLYVGVPGSVQSIVKGKLPSLIPGEFYNNPQTPVRLNSSGQVAFISTLSGTGVTTANDRAIFAGMPGDLVQVVREGDIIDVDPGPGVINRTVANFGIFNGYELRVESRESRVV